MPTKATTKTPKTTLRAAAGFLCLSVGTGSTAARAEEAPAPAGPAAAPSPELERPRFRAEPMLLEAHLAAGIEPHGFRCNTASASTCTVTAYNVGASALWRGLVGPAIAIYASEGSPLVPADVTQTAFGDRISATVGLAVRPFAPLGWHRPDGWVSRLAYAFSVEVGPSLEYLRTSAITIAGCDIPATRVQGGASGLFGLDVPVLGDARSGWLSLRASVRVLGNDEAHLAPTANTGGCSALVVMPGVLAQALFGVGYSF